MNKRWKWSILKSYMMPVSMAIGIVFYEYLYHLAVITPYLVSIMLFISYCNISLRDIRICKLHFLLLLIQILGSVGVYSILSLYDRVVAQGVMVCILAPTATSAIVITGILKGNIVSLTTYSLLSNMAVVIIAPVIFAVIGYDNGISFWDSLFNISEKIFLILLLPFVLSMLFRKILPLAYEKLRKKQTISFYLWNTALIIVTAKTVMFIMQQEKGNYQIELIVAVLALVVCISQFLIGRKLGRKYNDTIAAGQGLGQKNTILAIWMSQVYLNPVASIGPGAYVLWQNIVNSYQVWKMRK